MQEKEIFKTANKTTSFICESLFGYEANERRYDKIGLILIKRDKADRAEQTARFYLDIPVSKVVFEDIWSGKFPQVYPPDKDKPYPTYCDFKKLDKGSRGLSIQHGQTSYRISVRNFPRDGEKVAVYFDLTFFQARQLAISVLDHIRNWELAKNLSGMIAEKLHETNNGNRSREFTRSQQEKEKTTRAEGRHANQEATRYNHDWSQEPRNGACEE